VQWEDTIAVLCMAGLVLLTLANVVVRYLTDETLAPTEEVSIALMVIMTLAGACGAATRDRHVRIDFFLRDWFGVAQAAPRFEPAAPEATPDDGAPR